MDELTQSNGGIVMAKGGKDAFLSKVTFRRESDWYSKTTVKRVKKYGNN